MHIDAVSGRFSRAFPGNPRFAQISDAFAAVNMGSDGLTGNDVSFPLERPWTNLARSDVVQ